MTWMKHGKHGGIADLPDIPLWRAAGWEPTDERPAEPDLYRDPPPPTEPEPIEAPDAAAPGLSAAKPKKSAKAAPTEDGESDG